MASTVASSVLWSLCRTWGGRLAGFVIYFQLARLLSPAEMGLFSAAFAIFILFEIVVDQGMVQAIVQRPRVTPGMLNAVLGMNIVSACAMAAALFFSASSLESLFKVPGLEQVIQVSSLCLLFSSGGFCQEAMARRDFKFQLLAVRTLVSTVAGGAVGVYLAATGHGVWALVAQMLVSAAINTTVLWLRPSWSLRTKWDFQELPSLVSFGSQVTGIRLVEFLGTRGVELLVAACLGASALGTFAVGTKIHYILLQLLGMALIDVAQSGFARIASDQQRLRKAFLSSVGTVAILSTPVWVIVSACAPEVSAIAFGAKWSDSAQVLMPFALLGALQVVQNFDTAAFNALGRPAMSIALTASRAIFALSSVWLFQSHGLQAVALAYVGSQVLLSPLNLWLLRRVLGIEVRQWIGRIWPAVVAGLCTWYAIDSFRALGSLQSWSLIPRFLALAALGSSVYLAVMGLLQRDRLGGLLQHAQQLKKL